MRGPSTVMIREGLPSIGIFIVFGMSAATVRESVLSIGMSAMRGPSTVMIREGLPSIGIFIVLGMSATTTRVSVPSIGSVLTLALTLCIGPGIARGGKRLREFKPLCVGSEDYHRVRVPFSDSRILCSTRLVRP